MLAKSQHISSYSRFFSAQFYSSQSITIGNSIYSAALCESSTTCSYSANIQFEAGSSIYSTPTIDASFVRWKYLTTGPVISSPVLDNSQSRLYVGSIDGYLYALTTSWGSLVWSYYTSSAGIVSSPSYISNLTQSPLSSAVIITSLSGSLYALTSTGSFFYSVRTNGSIYSSPIIDVSLNIYFGSTDGNIYAVSHPSGSLRWTSSVALEVFSSAAVSPKSNAVYFTVTSRNTSYAILLSLSTTDGSLNWIASLGSNRDLSLSTQPVVSAIDGTIYVANSAATLFAVSSKGSIKWSYPIGSSPMNSKITIDSSGKVIFLANSLYVISYPYIGVASYDNKIRNSSAGTSIHSYHQMSAPTLGPDAIYFGTPNGAIYTVTSNFAQSALDNFVARIVYLAVTIGTFMLVGIFYIRARQVQQRIRLREQSMEEVPRVENFLHENWVPCNQLPIGVQSSCPICFESLLHPDGCNYNNLNEELSLLNAQKLLIGDENKDGSLPENSDDMSQYTSTPCPNQSRSTTVTFTTFEATFHEYETESAVSTNLRANAKPTSKNDDSGVDQETFLRAIEESKEKNKALTQSSLVSLVSNYGQAVMLPCRHVFHESCIRSWTTAHNSCPVCRFKPTTSTCGIMHDLNSNTRESHAADSPSNATPDSNRMMLSRENSLHGQHEVLSSSTSSQV